MPAERRSSSDWEPLGRRRRDRGSGFCDGSARLRQARDSAATGPELPVRSTTSAAMTNDGSDRRRDERASAALEEAAALAAGSTTGVSSSVSTASLAAARAARRAAARKSSSAAVRASDAAASRAARHRSAKGCVSRPLRAPDMNSVSELGAPVSEELSGESVPGSSGKSDASSLSSGSGEKDSARPPVARRRSWREVRRLSRLAGG